MLSSFAETQPQAGAGETQSLNARARSSSKANPAHTTTATATTTAAADADRRRYNSTRRTGGGRAADIIDETPGGTGYGYDDYSFGPTGGSEREGTTAPSPARSRRSLFAQDDAAGAGHDLSSIGGRGGGGGGLSRSSSGRGGGGGAASAPGGGGSAGGAPASPSQSALDAAQVSARRRTDREAKMRAMEEAVAEGRSSLRDVYASSAYGGGSTNSNNNNNHSDPANHGLTAMPNLDDVRLREDGRYGSPNHLDAAASPPFGSDSPNSRQMAGLLHKGGAATTAATTTRAGWSTASTASSTVGSGTMAPPLAERIKSMMPAYWGAPLSEDRQPSFSSSSAGPPTFPGSSLSARSLTTDGRNLHDIGTSVPNQPPRNAFLSATTAASGGGGGGSNSQGSARFKLKHSNIEIDYFDPDTEAAQWSANGNRHGEGGTNWYSSTLGNGGGGGWMRSVNTVVVAPVREVLPTNRKKCVLWVAALALVGAVFGALAKVEEGTGSPAAGGATAVVGGSGSGGVADPHDQSPGASSTPPPPKVKPTFANPNLTKDGRAVTTAGKDRMAAILSRILDSGVTADAGALPTRDQVESKDGPFRGAAPADDATPQLKALAWIALYDERQVSPDDEYLLERYALAVFWYATYEASAIADVADPPQPGTDQQYNFLKHDGWMTHLGVCSWMGVQCHHLGVDKSAVRYDADHTVTYLNLTRNSVRGTIPEELWTTFVDLRVLDLSHNFLAGTIGEEIGEWDDLEVVYLNDSELNTLRVVWRMFLIMPSLMHVALTPIHLVCILYFPNLT